MGSGKHPHITLPDGERLIRKRHFEVAAFLDVDGATVGERMRCRDKQARRHIGFGDDLYIECVWCPVCQSYVDFVLGQQLYQLTSSGNDHMKDDAGILGVKAL